MADLTPSFEQTDRGGVTTHFNADIGTTATALPAVADRVISEFYIMNPLSNVKTKLLLVSLDGGVNFKSIPWNSDFAWSPKGGIRQIFVKGSASLTAYEAIINFEEA